MFLSAVAMAEPEPERFSCGPASTDETGRGDGANLVRIKKRGRDDA